MNRKTVEARQSTMKPEDKSSNEYDKSVSLQSFSKIIKMLVFKCSV